MAFHHFDEYQNSTPTSHCEAIRDAPISRQLPPESHLLTSHVVFQCSGSQPCSLCNARSRPCVFSNTPASVFLSKKNDQSGQGSPNSAASPSDRPPKRRKQQQQAQKPPRSDAVDAVDANDSLAVVEEGSKNSVDEEETPVHNEGRMLQDGEGRLR